MFDLGLGLDRIEQQLHDLQLGRCILTENLGLGLLTGGDLAEILLLALALGPPLLGVEIGGLDADLRLDQGRLLLRGRLGLLGSLALDLGDAFLLVGLLELAGSP